MKYESYDWKAQITLLWVHRLCIWGAIQAHPGRIGLQTSGSVWNSESTNWIELQKQCKRGAPQLRRAQVNFTTEHPDWTRPVCSPFVSRQDLAKTFKKLKSRNGFLSYLQDRTANPANPAAIICSVLVCPQKAIVRIKFPAYLWNPLRK